MRNLHRQFIRLQSKPMLITLDQWLCLEKYLEIAPKNRITHELYESNDCSISIWQNSYCSLMVMILSKYVKIDGRVFH